MKKWRFLSVASVFSAVFMLGCSSFDMTVFPSKELEKVYGHYPTFEVDVAGISSEDAIKLQTLSLEKYFEPQSAVRKYFSPVTLYFSDRDLAVKKIKSGSPEYDKIMSREPDYIALIANLPFADSESKDLDPRKFIYKIPKGFFSSSPDLFVKIGGTGLIRTTEKDARADLPEAPETIKQPVTLKLNCKFEQGKKNASCVEMDNKQVIPGE